MERYQASTSLLRSADSGRGGVEVELMQHRGALGLDRLDADAEDVGDRLVGLEANWRNTLKVRASGPDFAGGRSLADPAGAKPQDNAQRQLRHEDQGPSRRPHPRSGSRARFRVRRSRSSAAPPQVTRMRAATIRTTRPQRLKPLPKAERQSRGWQRRSLGPPSAWASDAPGSRTPPGCLARGRPLSGCRRSCSVLAAS
jgi:hypothetical protein